MKKFIISALVIGLCGNAFAQKETHYSKLYYKNMDMENSDIRISVDNAVSTDGETKFKLKITNKTSDFIIYKPEESMFIINGKETKAEEKWLVIGPNESDFRIINLKGKDYNSVKNYSFKMDGVYKVSTNAKGIDAPDYKLPVAVNEFKAGDYTVKMSKLYKETDATNLKFDITYNGSKTGLVFPTKAAVVMPDGKEYAAVPSTGLLAKSGPTLFLKKGQTESVTLNWNRMEGGKAMDMQKVDMLVKFHDMFTETTPEKLKAETLNLEFDQATSDAKGK